MLNNLLIIGLVSYFTWFARTNLVLEISACFFSRDLVVNTETGHRYSSPKTSDLQNLI